ncbi:hypothetical protein M885DRAFT_579111, partial [Pelagophyceae sp. CCMP2097]
AGACADDADWFKEGTPFKTCAWVAEDTADRCRVQGVDGTNAFQSCQVTCGTCDCADSKTWAKGGNFPMKSCIWVGKNINRCAKEDTDGTKASVACPRACDTCPASE